MYFSNIRTTTSKAALLAKYGLGLCLIASVLPSCIDIPNEYAGLPPGMWRATLNLTYGNSESSFDERSNGLLPFNFSVDYINDTDFHITIENGVERIRLDQISHGRDARTAKDTFRIAFPVFDSYIHATYEEDALEGFWYVPARTSDYKIPFKALHGKTHRFSLIDPAEVDVSGKWAVEFNNGNGDQYPAIGVFSQDVDGTVTGTFEIETGDYRFLAGNASGNRMFLSAFDGSHAFMFEAKVLEDGIMSGIFRSGVHYKNYWSGQRNDTVKLTSASKLTYIEGSSNTFDFAFESTSGKTVTPNDPEYAGKPKIIQIMGTYCPNCRDETEFLIEYLEQNPDPGFEIIALAFERYRDAERAHASISRYKEHFGLPYEILYAGTSSKQQASETLAMLNRVVAYPTLIFLNGDNEVVKIHTGFNGPATDKYEDFKREFDEAIKLILP